MPRREATPCPDPSASPQAPGRQLPRELRSPQEKANPPNTDATVPRAGGVSGGPGQRARPHLEAPDDQQGMDVVVTDVLHDLLHVALGQSPAAGDGQTDTQRPHRPQDGSTHVHAALTCPSPQGAGPVGLRFLVRGGSGGSRPRAYGGHCGGPAPAHHPHRPLARRLGSPSALRPGCELPAGVGPQSSASHPGDRRRAPGQRAPGRRVGAGFPWRLLGRAAVGTSHSAARGGQRPAAHRLVPSMEPPRPSQPATSCQLTSCTCREEAPLQGAGQGPGPLPRRRPCAQGQHALRGTEAVPAVAAQPQVKAGLRAWAGHSQGGPSPSPSSSDPSSSWTGLAAPRWCTGGPACPGETGGGL